MSAESSKSQSDFMLSGSRLRKVDGLEKSTGQAQFTDDLDTPELESLIVESIDPEGPYGAKEAGEGPLHPSIPAIANAIYCAVGIRMDSLPFSPPRVWRALEHAREAGALGEPEADARRVHDAAMPED